MSEHLRNLELCALCGTDHTDPQWAIVAFSSVRSTSVVLASSPAVACDQKEGYLDPEDAWGPHLKPSTNGSFAMWNGHIVYEDNPYSEGDVEYVGTFRAAGVEDLQLAGVFG